jgi:cystathionine gamma-synthase
LLHQRRDEGRIAWEQADLYAAGMEIAHGTDLVWVETPSNPMLDIVDISAVAQAAHQVGARLCVDNTVATPILQSPLSLGADLVVHSATKCIGGHSDLLLGAVVVAEESAWQRLTARRSASGAVPGALETFLALRGLRTLPLRLERASRNAADLAERLVAHDAVESVRYPGLRTHPARAVIESQMRGGGLLLSFEVVGGRQAAERVCERLSLIVHATSLGGVETLIERRAKYEQEAASGVPEGLLRLSVGIEHVDDLWADLSQALG